MEITQGPDLRRIDRRAATIYFWLGAVDVLIVFSGETITLLLFMIGLYFWVFIAWVAGAAYAAYLSWFGTRRTALRMLSAIALLHVGFGVAYPGVPLPWGGMLNGGLAGQAAQIVCRFGWFATALAMMILAFVARWRDRKFLLEKRTTASHKA